MGLQVNTIAMLNAIRDSASAEYQARVPQATRDNITAVGNAITNYVPILNEFTSVLVGKIGMTLFSDKMAKNRLAKFKKGTLPYGTDIEEIFVDMISSIPFDVDGKDVLARKKPDNIKVMYHRENRRDTYTVTVSDAQVKMAFRSAEGVAELLNKIVNAMYSTANHDEFVMMKELLARHKDNYATYEVSAITDSASASKFVKTTRKAVNDLSFMTDKFNKAGVKTYSDVSDLVLLVNKDVIAEVDVEVLAKAFNMGKTDFEPTIIVLDDFGSMADTYALLVDREFFMVFDTLNTVESQRNSKGLFTNYFLHIWQIQSLSHFKNAVKFIKK